MAQCSSSALQDQIRRDLERRRKVVNAAKERVARKSFASTSPSPRQSALISSTSTGAVIMNRANAGKEGVANKRSAPPPTPHRPALIPFARIATTNAAGKKIAYLDLGEAPKRPLAPRKMRTLTSSTMLILEKSSASPSACRSALISSISTDPAAVKLANATKEAVGKKRSAPPPTPPHQSVATTNAAGKKIAYMELGEAKRRCTAPPRRFQPRR